MGIGINIEKYKPIAEKKRQEKERVEKIKDWREGFNKEAKKMYGEKMAEMRNKERKDAHEAKMAKWKERGEALKGKIGKTIETASIVRYAGKEMGRDTLMALKQGAENKIGQLAERGNEAYNKCSGKIEGIRSKVNDWIEKFRDRRKIEKTKKLIKEAAPILQQITENVAEMKKRNQERIKPRIKNLQSLLEIRAAAA